MVSELVPKLSDGESEKKLELGDMQGATWRILHPAKLFDFKQQVCINPLTDRTQAI